MIFQDFPGPGIFKKKIQDFPGGVGTLSHGLTNTRNITEVYIRRDRFALDGVFALALPAAVVAAAASAIGLCRL